MSIITYNPTEIQAYLTSQGHIEAGGVTEVRLFPKNDFRGNRTIHGKRVFIGKTVSGYYDDYSKLVQDIAPFDGHADIYVTLNPVKRDLLARAVNRLEYNAEVTTSDADILADLWFPFDLDPVRPAKISSTEEELEFARQRCLVVCDFFQPFGIQPIIGMSGNGYHGLIRLIGYPNTEETAPLKERLTKFLAETFSDDRVTYDATVFNMARIWKLYGVMAVKGDSLPERPHRRAYLDIPDELPAPVDLYAMMDRIIPADWQKESNPSHTPPQHSRADSDYPLLDVQRYLTHYGYSFSTKQKDGRTLYILDRCPFNPDHNQGEVCITQEANGKVGFKCFHNSCTDKGWQEAKAAIGDPKPCYQERHNQNGKTRPSDTSSPLNGANQTETQKEKDGQESQEDSDSKQLEGESEPATPRADFNSILQEIGRAAVILDDYQKSQSVIQIVDQMVFLEPAEQTPLIDRMKAVGLGSKASLEAQLKKSKQRRASEHNEERLKQAQTDNDLPTIETTFRHLRNVTKDTLDAIRLQNQKAPRIFVRGGVLNRIKPYESKSLICEVMTASAVRGEIERAANYVGGKDYLGNPISMPIHPPTDVVSDLMALPEWKGIPVLIGINHAPVFTPDGSFDLTVGYQSKSRFYYAPDKALQIGDTTPTDETVEAAKTLIFDELLGEFCFADDDSKANALALMLLPFVRPLIDGPTPLHLIDAPIEGSGKGLLADVLTIPFKPDGGTLMTEGESDEEWRKRITAALSEAPSHILIDNINKRLESGSLAAALTAPYWSDRQLGTNTILKFPVTQTWIATGNNVEMSREITRRTVWIRLRPSVEDPSQHDFKIDNLRKWAREHRSELVSACLTLIRKWVATGMFGGNVRKGSYEAWAETMSGILDAIGVEGFLGNYARLNEKANEDLQLWREFVRAWYAKHGFDEVGVAELFLIASTKEASDVDGRQMEIGQNLLDDLLKSDKERGRQIRLGELLKSQVDRVYGKYRILRAGMKKNAVQYRLELVDDRHHGGGESSETKFTDSPSDSPPPKTSDNVPFCVCGESGESKQAHAREGEGGIYPPPSVDVETEIDSFDSLPSVNPASFLNDNQGESDGESKNSDSPNSRAFLQGWQSTHGNQMVYVEQLIPIAQEAGFNLTAHDFSQQTNIETLLRDLTDITIDGLTVRCLDDDAYQLEGTGEKPAKLRCPQCDSYTPHTLTETGDGWLLATCERCGKKVYTRPEAKKVEELL